MYDSVHGHVNSDVREVICNILDLPIHVKHVLVEERECGRQDGVDFGVHAIANAVLLSYREHPEGIQYSTSSRIRNHLVKCFEENKLNPFPIASRRIVKSTIRHVQTFDIHCSCRMPDTGSVYFECTKCKEWFHPVCEGYGALTQLQIKRRKTLKCRICKA